MIEGIEGLAAHIKANPTKPPLVIMATWMAAQCDERALRAAATGAHVIAAKLDTLGAELDILADDLAKRAPARNEGGPGTKH